MDACKSTPAAGNEPNGVDADEQHSGELTAGLLLEYQSGAAHIQKQPFATDECDVPLSIETSCGKVIVEARAESDGELATAGFELDAERADRLATLLSAFADHARQSERNDEHWQFP